MTSTKGQGEFIVACLNKAMPGLWRGTFPAGFFSWPGRRGPIWKVRGVVCCCWPFATTMSSAQDAYHSIMWLENPGSANPKIFEWFDRLLLRRRGCSILFASTYGTSCSESFGVMSEAEAIV